MIRYREDCVVILNDVALSIIEEHREASDVGVRLLRQASCDHEQHGRDSARDAKRAWGRCSFITCATMHGSGLCQVT